jgi:triacylglycerol lipase
MSGTDKHSRSRHLVAAELVEALESRPPFIYSDDSLQLLRQGLQALIQTTPPLMDSEQSVAREERWIPGPAGAPDVRVLIYTPTGNPGQPKPVYLHIHGGGYVLGNPEINDGINRPTASELQCVVVSVDYRLAPETRFPHSLEDCYAALQWLYANAEELAIDRSRIAIVGESAGGGHAAALAILARDRGEIPICLQLLDSPMLDDRTASAEPHPFCGEFIWTHESNRFGWQALLGMEPGSADVPERAAPARVRDCSGLPPTFIAVGALDIFFEENLEYARRLVRAGVPTELHVIPGAFHGFPMAGPQAPQVQMLLRLRRDALARAFQH